VLAATSDLQAECLEVFGFCAHEVTGSLELDGFIVEACGGEGVHDTVLMLGKLSDVDVSVEQTAKYLLTRAIELDGRNGGEELLVILFLQFRSGKFAAILKSSIVQSTLRFSRS